MDSEQITRFTLLWTQAQSAVLAFISATVRDFTDADDVLQSVAKVAVTKFDEFDRDGDRQAFVKWTITIARFEVLAFLRKQSQDRHCFLADSIAEIATAFEELAPQFDARRRALSQCLEKLQQRSRSVLEKRYGEGLKTGQIAEQLGVSPGSISMILNRACNKLRQCIEHRLAEVPS